MATITEKFGDLEDQVIEVVKSVQEPVVETVGKAVARLEEVLPELPAVPALDRLPEISEVVDQQFGFAAKLLENQREFVAALIDAVKPITSQLRETPKAKAKPKAAPKAAAAA